MRAIRTRFTQIRYGQIRYGQIRYGQIRYSASEPSKGGGELNGPGWCGLGNYRPELHQPRAFLA